MNKKLTLGSLFDGSGGFPLGGLLSGITPVWASEVEPFPIRVTTKRLPFMKHYGDISGMNGGEIEPVDIITFGSPCTDMSIAGKRAGLDGKQSSLFYQAIRIVKEMRCATNGKYPRFIVWENVPGAFSSNNGEDFKAVLEAVIGVVCPGTEVPSPEKNRWPYADLYMGDGWSLAYRTLDAQYWGVPQRRRRIYLVADFAGGSAGKVLFESEGVSGYSAESFRTWQRAARDSASGFGETSECYGVDGYNSAMSDVVATLGVNCGFSTGRNGIVLNDQGGNRMDVTHEVTSTLRAESHHPPLVFENHSQDTRYKGPLETAQTVSATYGMGGNNQPFVVETPKTLKIRSGCEGGGKGALIQEDKSATLSCNNDQTVFVPKCYGICSKESNSMKSDNPHSGFYEADTSRCLDANGGNPSCNQGGMAVVSVQGSMIGRSDKNGPQGSGIGEDVSFTLNTVDHHAVAFSQDAYDRYSENDKCGALRAKGGMYGGGSESLVYSTSKGSYHTDAEVNLANTLMASDYKDPPIVTEQPRYVIRRLTPTECARLQGFADWWCSDLATPDPTESEIELWELIWETHRRIVGGGTKPKTRNQIIKWLKAPHTDSAEYKMWGNGVALPCVFFVLSGIAWVMSSDTK